MELRDAIYDTKKQLLNKFKEVKYYSTEKVRLTKNSVQSSFLSVTPNMNISVERISDRCKIEGTIPAVKIIFEVKPPRKRKFIYHYEYFKIL